VLCLAFALLLTANPAGAQDPQSDPACQNTTTSAYPPQGGGDQLEALTLDGGHLPPGSSLGTMTVSGGVAGLTYCGRMFSATFAIPNKSANAQGKLVYTNLAIPTGFELNAAHHLDVFRSGRLVGSFDYCVNGNADVVALKSSSCATAVAGSSGSRSNAGSSGTLPHTGFDRFWQMLRVALVALAIGALALYSRRRLAAERTA
jgi:hypothetical protein